MKFIIISLLFVLQRLQIMTITLKTRDNSVLEIFTLSESAASRNSPCILS